MISEIRQKRRADPVQAAQEAGTHGIQALDAGNPEAFAQGLRQRATQVADLARDMRTAPVLLSRAETRQWAQSLQRLPPARQYAALAGAAQALNDPDMVDTLMRQLSAQNPALALAGVYLARDAARQSREVLGEQPWGPRPDVPMLILKGQGKLAPDEATGSGGSGGSGGSSGASGAKPYLLPDDALLRQDLANRTGGAYAAAPGQTEMLLAAAKAVYAALDPGAGDGKLDPMRWGQAVELVTDGGAVAQQVGVEGSANNVLISGSVNFTTRPNAYAQADTGTLTDAAPIEDDTPSVEAKPTAAGDALYEALVDGLGNPPSVGPGVKLDDFGRPTGPLIDRYNLSNKDNWAPYLKSVAQRRAQDLPLDPQDVSTAKALAHYYLGFPMGKIRGEPADLHGNLDDKALANLPAALETIGRASDEELRQRRDFYAGIVPVEPSRGQGQSRERYVDVTRVGRTVRLRWTPDFSDWASHVGVSPEEALRKTDFSVYKAVLDAAFETDGVHSVNINGAWRPSFGDYEKAYETLKDDPNADKAVVKIMKKTIDAKRKHPWSQEHVTNHAVDINDINGTSTNNGGFTKNAPILPEPDIVKRFTDNLVAASGRDKVIQPWRIWGKNAVSPRNNPGKTVDEQIHGNHIHFSLN